MFKKFVMSLGLVLGLITGPVFAAKEIYFTASPSGIEFSFEPNQGQVFTNAFPWAIKATCQVSCDDNVFNQMQAKILKKSGSLNDMPLAMGDSMCLDMHNGDTFKMLALSGAKVELKNTGNGTIKATCFVAN